LQCVYCFAGRESLEEGKVLAQTADRETSLLGYRAPLRVYSELVIAPPFNATEINNRHGGSCCQAEAFKVLKDGLNAQSLQLTVCTLMLQKDVSFRKYPLTFRQMFNNVSDIPREIDTISAADMAFFNPLRKNSL
jgi:hypothetical protein